ELDVALDVANVPVAKPAVMEPLDGVVDVEPLLRLGRRLDVPAEELHLERLGDVVGEEGLSGAGLAAEEERPLEREGDVHRVTKTFGGDVRVRALEPIEARIHPAKGSTDRGHPSPRLLGGELEAAEDERRIHSGRVAGDRDIDLAWRREDEWRALLVRVRDVRRALVGRRDG